MDAKHGDYIKVSIGSSTRKNNTNAHKRLPLNVGAREAKIAIKKSKSDLSSIGLS